MIINTSSMADGIGTAGMQFYNASKHAALGLTRSVALEAISQSVRINAVAPGSVRTPMFIAKEKEVPEMTEMVKQMTPIGRCAEPSRLKLPTLFCTSLQIGPVIWWGNQSRSMVELRLDSFNKPCEKATLRN